MTDKANFSWCLWRRGLLLILGSLLAGSLYAAEEQQQQTLTGEDIVSRCGTKYRGDDLRSKFIVERRDSKGNVKRSEYLRIWKDFKGRDNVADKMILFQIYPPEAKGAAFMRATYVPEFNKAVDQWIYLPLLKKIRRVTIRNPGDRFLNTNLTYADVSQRALDEDNHKYLGIKKLKDKEFYVVESTPKEKKPLYSKRIYWYSKEKDWDQCVNVRIDYFDANGAFLKDQFIKWQKVNGAWIWSRVLVRTAQDGTASGFILTGLSVNTGLEDSIFSERTLVKGPGAVPKLKPPKDKPNTEQ